jgi:soluble cytochrome b562
VSAEEKTHLSQGKLKWAHVDRAAFEVSTEAPAPSDVHSAIELLIKRKSEIERAQHVSTFKAGADREIGAIDELLKTLNECLPQAA